jgi:hypothetical protein
MAEYGLLRSSTNTGLRSELIAIFTAPLSIISKKPNFSSETVTLKRRSVVTDIQRWEITAGIQPFEGASELLVHSVVTDIRMRFMHVCHNLILIALFQTI